MLFFVGCIQVFMVAGRAGMPLVVRLYVCGHLQLTMIAQFWSFANDVYTKAEGDRLFPLIAVGSTAGAPLARRRQALFARGCLLGDDADRGRAAALPARGSGPALGSLSAPLAVKGSGFGLVLGNRYLRLVALSGPAERRQHDR